MEAPGRDVTADPLDPEPETLPDDAPRREETAPDDAPREGQDDAGERPGA
jgi:hypothetical protein